MSVEIKNLNYIYAKGSPFEKQALKDVTVTFNKGEFIGLIGHTGSGKSTLVQHINRLIKPTSGTIIINGQDINDKNVNIKEIRQRVGLVFQYPEHQLFEISVFKDVAFGPKNMGVEGEVLKKRVVEALKRVGIQEELYEKSPFELSGGQKRRVAIAGVLAMKPDILILDEPTAGLDPRGRDEILDEIKQIHEEDGITIILVSHSMEDVANYVQRLVVMDKGVIRLDGAPKDVFKEIELLESMGLAVPKVTYLMEELRKKGFNIEEDVTTVEQAVGVLKRLFATKMHAGNR